jgi:hypothetical protein
MFPKRQHPPDPRVKLLMSYDIVPETRQNYYEFLTREFLPQLQARGLMMTDAWHTAYGDYPVRLLAFAAPDRKTLNDILHGDKWQELEGRLKQYVTNLRSQIAPYKEGFQF